MKHPISFVVLLLWAVSARAEPLLVGRWVSDRDSTMSFNTQHAQLQPKTVEFLTQMMGRLTVTFTAEEVTLHMPDWVAETNNKKHEMVGFSETHPYKILATTKSTIAIQTSEPVTGEDTIFVYNFEGADKMWLYIYNVNMHIREYFTRVPQG